MLLKLTGKTNHGKNRINQHGEIWRVKEDSTFRGQPAWHLQSIDKTFGGFKDGHRDFDGRWVLKQNDPNFDWEIVEETTWR